MYACMTILQQSHTNQANQQKPGKIPGFFILSLAFSFLATTIVSSH
jgi:hypothetical protein